MRDPGINVRVEAAIEDTRRRIEPNMRWFLYGDLTGREGDYWSAIECLDEVKDLRGEDRAWAYDLVRVLAFKAAKEWKRERGQKTTYHFRNQILAAAARPLIERNFPLTRACAIIHEALARLKHHSLTTRGIEKAIRSQFKRDAKEDARQKELLAKYFPD
jgi:hypothetical protein